MHLRPRLFAAIKSLPSIRRHILAPAAGAVTLLGLLLPAVAFAQDATPATVDAITPLCRLGVNAASDPIEKFDIAQLRTGFYIDYTADASPVHPNGAEYMPIIGLEQIQRGKDDYAYHPNGAALDAAIAANLGATWIIGNEPDRRYYQNDMEPAAYARAYHDLYRLLKSKDPNATVLAGAIVQPTPLRLQYLDLVLRAYVAKYREPMPIDGWAIHNFILNERSCEYYLDPAHRPPDYDGPEPYNGAYVCWGADIPPGISATDGLVIHLNELDKTGDINFFKTQIVRFRQWMADRGYANKPLYVTEFGILMPEDRGFPPARVSQYLSDSFSYLLTATDPRLGFSADGRRLVQRFAWYSTYDATHNGSLFQSASPSGAGGPYVLSSIGQTFKDVAAAQALTQSPQLMSLELEPGAPLAVDGKTNFTLKATVGNSGTALSSVNVTVRFYLGDPAAGGVKIGNDQIVQVSGCGDTAVATVVWKDVNPSESGKRVYAEMVYNGQTTKTYRALFFATTRLYLGEVFRVP